jgi:hypothetical protein
MDENEPRQCQTCGTTLKVHIYTGFNCNFQMMSSRTYTCEQCDPSKAVARETRILSGPFTLPSGCQ